MQVYDALIVGGGLAGSLAAIHLAEKGLRVCLFEKEKAPHHKVCGEYLSEEACYYLEEVGFDFNFAQSPLIDDFSFHAPKVSLQQKLQRKARGISRFLLDQFLLDKAESLGVQVLLGERVKAYKREKEYYLIEGQNQKVLAPLLLLATGKHDLPKLHKRVGKERDLVGFKIHLDLTPAHQQNLENSIELFSFEGGYGGLSPIEAGRFNLCFLLEKKKLKDHSLTHSWELLQSYLSERNGVLADRLRMSQKRMDRPVTISGVPYGHMLDPSKVPPGVFLLGDQAAVIPSFTGEGMSIALLSARMATDLIVSHKFSPSASHKYHDYLARILKGRMNLALPIHSLMRGPLASIVGHSIKWVPGVVPFLFEKTRCPEAYYWRTMG